MVQNGVQMVQNGGSQNLCYTVVMLVYAVYL